MHDNAPEQLSLLVVDDEESITELVSYMLANTPYHVRIANSGEDALAMIRDAPVDILLTDINMPDISGLELTEEVLRICPDTLVIAITGYADIDLVVHFMRRGGVDFLQKPINKTALRVSVQSAEEKHRLRERLRQASEELRQMNAALQQEIIERRCSQEALQASERRYREVFENAPFGIYQASMEGEFIRVNPAMARIFGFASPDEMVSTVKDISKLYVQPDQRKETLGTTLGCNGWIAIQMEFFRKDKTILIAQVTMRAVRNGDAAPLYLEGFVEDITEREGQRRAFDLEMARAQEIYDLVLEPEMPMMPGVEIHVKSVPAKRIGGDVLEILKLNEKRFLIFLADVTGHGIPAAMTASTLKTLFREISKTEADPATICRHLNGIICKTTLPDDVIVAFCGRMDLEAMTLTYYLSGLPFPVILRDDEKIRLKPTGLPLGIFDNPLIKCNVFTLQKGDIFIAFTDGVTEARSEDHEIFGNKAVEGIVRCGKWGLHTIVEDIVSAAFQFRQKQAFQDDVIILAIRFSDGDENTFPMPGNRFCTPEKCVFKMKTRHIRIDSVIDFVMTHLEEKHGTLVNMKLMKIAFSEVLSNAVEHGNLEMTALKNDSDFYGSEKYRQIYDERKHSDKYGDKMILIECLHHPDHLEISVEDEGPGFDLAAVPDPTREENLTRLSGRGIAVAKMYADQVTYKGSKAIMMKMRMKNGEGHGLP